MKKKLLKSKHGNEPLCYIKAETFLNRLCINFSPYTFLWLLVYSTQILKVYSIPNLQLLALQCFPSWNHKEKLYFLLKEKSNKLLACWAYESFMSSPLTFKTSLLLRQYQWTRPYSTSLNIFFLHPSLEIAWSSFRHFLCKVNKLWMKHREHMSIVTSLYDLYDILCGTCS